MKKLLLLLEHKIIKIGLIIVIVLAGFFLFYQKTNALKPLTSAMGIQGETPLGVKCHMK
nr:hypothetical protein [Helicobacter pylori]